MSVLIVQSTEGGGNVVVSTTATSNPLAFNANTVAGNLLICVVWAKSEGTTPTVMTIGTPVTSGFTWVRANAGLRTYAGCAIYYIQNASSMITSKTTTVTVTGGGGTGESTGVEISLYEVSGPTITGVLDTSQEATGTASSPSTPNLATSFTDFIIAAVYGNGASAQTAGAGYTLGQDSSVLGYGSSEYILSQPSGSVPAAFGGSYTYWAMVSAAFKLVSTGVITKTQSFIIGL